VFNAAIRIAARIGILVNKLLILYIIYQSQTSIARRTDDIIGSSIFKIVSTFVQVTVFKKSNPAL